MLEAKRIPWSILFLALALAFAGQASAAPLRYGVDQTEILWLESKHPELAAKLNEGEALLAGSPSDADVERAATLFGEASDAQPLSVLLARRHCQALAALGQRDRAVAACTRALGNNSQSALTLRAMVGAMMAGPEPPTPAEVGNALLHVQRVKRTMANEPWGAAAECDVAVKLGDTEMLSRCVSTLMNLAPDHYETKRYAALLAQTRPGWKTVLALAALVAVVAGTALHAFVRRGRRAPAVAALAIVGAGLVPELARAEDPPAPPPEEAAANNAAAALEERRPGQLSKYKIDDADPEKDVPTPEQRDKDPLEFGYYLMDLGDLAEKAKAVGDHLKAAKVYRAMAKAVPDVPVAFVKACEEYEKAKDLATAAEFCAAALTLKGVTLADYSRYARVVLAKKGKISDVDVGNLDKVVTHLKDDASTRSAALDIQCTLGVRLADRVRLEQCAPQLSQMAPDSPKTTFFEWALAIQKKDYAAAERLTKKARAAAKSGQASLDKEQLALMDQATFEALPVWRKGFRDWRFGAAVAAVLFAGLGLVLVRRRGGRREDVSAPPQTANPSA